MFFLVVTPLVSAKQQKIRPPLHVGDHEILDSAGHVLPSRPSFGHAPKRWSKNSAFGCQ